MKSTEPVPRSKKEEEKIETEGVPVEVEHKKSKEPKHDKKKAKRNSWPLKAMIITLLLAALVNIISNLVLSDAGIIVAIVITLVIVLLGVVFDIIGTAATSCDILPLLSMASRKVKGAKMAVKLAKKSDIVANVCNDIIGDICGIVSGACAATIAVKAFSELTATWSFILTVLVYAVISTLTITLKAAGKGFAVKKSTNIIFGVAKVMSIFSKEG